MFKKDRTIPTPCLSILGRKRGEKVAFAVVAILIVIVITLILIAVAFLFLLEARMRSRVAEAEEDVRTLVIDLESYHVDWPNCPSLCPNYSVQTKRTFRVPPLRMGACLCDHSTPDGRIESNGKASRKPPIQWGSVKSGRLIGTDGFCLGLDSERMARKTDFGSEN